MPEEIGDGGSRGSARQTSTVTSLTTRRSGTSRTTATSSRPTVRSAAGSASGSIPTSASPGGRPGSCGPVTPASARSTTRCRSPPAPAWPPPRLPTPHTRPRSSSTSAGPSRSSAWLCRRMQAQQFAQPEDAYTDTNWEPAEASLDLTWTTDGVPYHYDVTTRYEIPCLVSGTVTVGGETFSVDGQGQRDHSWGVRDWWAFGWCWNSMRLDDGTRTHAVDIRFDGFGAFFGYVQTPDQTPAVAHPLTALEAHRGSRRPRLPDHGARRAQRRRVTRVRANPPRHRCMTSGPRGEAAHRLRAGAAARPTRAAGLVRCFPRAMVRCRSGARPHGRRLDPSGTNPIQPHRGQTLTPESNPPR